MKQTPALNGSIPFSRNLHRMIMATPKDGKPTLYHSILKAYHLLGRTTEHIHSIDASSDPEEHARELRQLDKELSRFKLSLPRQATTLRYSPLEEAAQVVWLNTILSMVTVLLHHRPEEAEARPSQSPSERCVPVLQPDTKTSFEYCVTAARSVARFIQEATKISIDALLNPHIGSSLYGCGRILAIANHEANTEEMRSDIELFLLLFDRMTEIYPALGFKFRNGLRYALQQDVEGAGKMRADGARGMLTRCGDWSGGNPQATLDILTAAFGR